MKTFIKKMKGKKRKILASLLLIWSLKTKLLEATPIGADAWQQNYICRKRPTYSKQATTLSMGLEENSNNQNIPRENMNRYDRRIDEFDSTITDLQARKKFKHAGDFGILGDPNRKNFELFKDRIAEHIRDDKTKIKRGTYKKNIEVIHYFNEETGLNVMIRQDNNTF